MASKKDKFGKKVKSQLQKKLGDANESRQQSNIDQKNEPDINEIDLPSEHPQEIIQEKSQSLPNQAESDDSEMNREESMPRNRDSIYNVSTDIRLEDYTEDNDSGKNYAGIARFIGGLLLIILIAWGVYNFSGILFGPTYQVAITNEEVNEEAVAALNDQTDVVLSAARPVFIRFQWEAGGLKADYIRIRIISTQNNMEIAEMGRMVPVSVNYILFAGPLESGKYLIIIEDRSGAELVTREFMLR